MTSLILLRMNLLQVYFFQGAHSIFGCLPGKPPCSTLKEQILAKPTISSFSTIHQTDHVKWAGTTVEFSCVANQTSRLCAFWTKTNLSRDSWWHFPIKASNSPRSHATFFRWRWLEAPCWRKNLGDWRKLHWEENDVWRSLTREYTAC